MATYSKLKLSESTDGKPISIAATSSPGTSIHTAVSGTSSFDEIWLWAFNTSTTSNVKLTIEFGGSGGSNEIEFYFPAESGLKCVIPGFILQNEATVKAYASTASVISVVGYVNRIAA